MGMNRLFFAILIFFLSVNAFATYVAVLETAADGSAKDSVPFLDRQYLTNVLRQQAIKELPAAQNYTIMTRENIQQMLPPGKAVEECEGSCLVETGKNIAADYICQARVGRFGNSLTLSAELYETAGNKLIASFNGRGQSVEDLLDVVVKESREFFGMIREVTPSESVVQEAKTEATVEVVQADESVSSLNSKVGESKIGESIPANVGTQAPVNDKSVKKGGIHWVPFSIGAAATVTGVVLAVVGNNMAKNESKKKPNSKDEYDRRHDDIGSYQALRAVGIGLAIAGGIGVGLSFAF
jgi:hypothetical protein